MHDQFVFILSLELLQRRFFRAGIMYVPESSESHTQGQQNLLRSNMFSLSGTGFFGAVVRSIDLGEQ